MCKDNSKLSESHGLTINDYIKDEYSICREERQYAVYLYNILRAFGKVTDRYKIDQRIKGIFDACKIPEGATIEQVFYEVTFMRDFFERNRCNVLWDISEDNNIKKLLPLRKGFSDSQHETIYKAIKEDKDKSFNYKLINYVHKHIQGEKSDVDTESYSVREYNLGQNKIDCVELSSNEKDIIKWMMNAKPDIAVIYKKEKKEYLLFLECKFGSGEDYYNYSSKSTPPRIEQTKIQWMIADFLCKNYWNGMELSDQMENNAACLVQFVREKKTKSSKEIPIGDLIDLNNIILNKCYVQFKPKNGKRERQQ